MIETEDGMNSTMIMMMVMLVYEGDGKAKPQTSETLASDPLNLLYSTGLHVPIPIIRISSKECHVN